MADETKPKKAAPAPKKEAKPESSEKPAAKPGEEAQGAKAPATAKLKPVR